MARVAAARSRKQTSQTLSVLGASGGREKIYEVFTYLLSGCVLGFPNAAVPGPFQAYLLGQTVKDGWQRTLPVALAPVISDGPIIVLVLFVLSRLGEQTLAGIQILGAGFIFFLAFGAYRSYRTVQDSIPVGEGRAPLRHGILKGALMNALNPAPYIFWGAVGGPMLLNGFKEGGNGGVFFLVGFYGTLIGGFAVLIWLFGTIGRLGLGVQRSLSAVSAVALLLFGVWQLVGGVRLLAGL